MVVRTYAGTTRRAPIGRLLSANTSAAKAERRSIRDVRKFRPAYICVYLSHFRVKHCRSRPPNIILPKRRTPGARSAVESILVNVCRSRSPQFAGVCELCDEGPACTRIRRWPAARQLIGQPGCSRTTADVLLGPFRRCAGHGGPSSADRRLAEPVHLTPHMRLLPRAHSWETTSSNPVDPGSDG